MTRFILTVTVFISMKSTAVIDYVDVSSGRGADDDVDTPALPSPCPSGVSNTADTDPSEDLTPVNTTDAPRSAEAPVLVSADIHAVMLGLWASGLRCVIVYALAPTLATVGPLAVGAALVIQVAGTAVCLSGAHSLWVRRYRGRRAYVLIAALTCLCTLTALLAPAGF
ncbi:conserved domain protein [Actinomyces sp. oral taxon 170 str. F0386]|nr:conserved domain protein [Actinomyces sp. oral taxon 170 str. F0386]